MRKSIESDLKLLQSDSAAASDFTVSESGIEDSKLSPQKIEAIEHQFGDKLQTTPPRQAESAGIAARTMPIDDPGSTRDSLCIDTRKSRRLSLMRVLRSPELYRQLRLVFQPQWDIQSDRLRGFEALLRWNEPHTGDIPPDEFIPLMHKARILGEITDWVIHCACQWRQALPEDLAKGAIIAVNVATDKIHETGFAKVVKAALKAASLPTRLLEIEITESAAVIHAESSVRTLFALQAADISIAIDDFGVGFSSLSYLGLFPANVLKLGLPLTRRVAGSPAGRELVERTISLAHAFGLDVVAEGVERRSDVRLLHDMGCNAIQGYWLSQPLEATKVAPWLKEAAPLVIGK